MSRRIAAGVAIVVAVAAVLCSSASAATAPSPPSGPPAASGGATPLPPDEAEALATAPAAVPGGETTTAVSPEAALAASALPGADTSTDPGLTPAEAVGLTADGDGSGLDSLARLTMCWADRGWHGWGTWPYEQLLVQTTYWCAVYGDHVTYRSTTVTTGGTLCSTNWHASALIGGGIGFHGMTIRASAGYSCPTALFWIALHPSHHLDIFFGDRGRAVITGAG